jgi:hypothetical protein
LGATLAPFVWREKPDLSPAPAASFIKKAEPDQNLRTCDGVFRAVNNPSATSRQREFDLFLLHFLSQVVCGTEAPPRRPLRLRLME